MGQAIVDHRAGATRPANAELVREVDREAFMRIARRALAHPVGPGAVDMLSGVET
jgi:inosine-uridine nucleoside N-ribohydrolase